jgi:hypothetical protein
MDKILRLFLPFLLLAAATLACGSQPAPVPLGTLRPTAQGDAVEPVPGLARSFHLGFTPFPYDISQKAVDYTYARIAADADLIAIHMDNGIPWPEALAGDEFDAHIMEQWEQDRSHIPEGHAVYVAITPIAISRDGLAPYRAEADDLPLPAPWDAARFDDPDVKTAWLNYAERAIAYFQPVYLNIGIEVNLLAVNAPEKWPDFLELHQYVYTELKSRHPGLPIFVSLTGPDLLEGYTDADHAAQLQTLQDILPFTDYFALSLYPFMTAYGSDYPDSMWPDLWTLSQGKPIAVAESGMIAETLTLPTYNLRIEGSEEGQARFVTDLLRQADEQHFVFVVNFVLRDYDALWEKIGRTDLAAVWRDTGLYDEDGNPRPGLEVWRAALARPYHP